jgi:dehydrogenase/reductase SDR family protein 12
MFVGQAPRPDATERGLRRPWGQWAPGAVEPGSGRVARPREAGACPRARETADSPPMGPFHRTIDALAELSVVGSFSKLGLALRRGGFADEPLDLTGKRVVVTGATSGIGLATAAATAALGAAVTLVGRSADKLAAAAAQVPGAQTLRCDLSDLQAVRALGSTLAQSPPDVLVHNAGLLVAERGLAPQADGRDFEQGFAVHVLAPQLLNHLVEEHLAPGARVLWVSSGGMYTQKLDFEKLEARTGNFDGVEAYAQQKRAQVILSELWAARWQARGITSAAMHPGWASTPGVDSGLPTFAKVMAPLLRTPAEGADTLVWLCATQEPDLTGRFFHDRRPRSTEVLPGTRHDEALRRALWARVEAHIAPLL